MLDVEILKIASFSDGEQGGNPAGVFIGDALPQAEKMQEIAAQVGYSETAFATKEGDVWRTRYFSPESEVPFCGHATIALGAVLAMKFGDATFDLKLNEANISVEGTKTDTGIHAALQSPPTFSRPADPDLVSQALELFGYGYDDLDPAMPPAFANGGANHLVIGLKHRERLADMEYDLEAGKRFMRENELVTVCLAYAQTPTLFHSRNPFASGGVYEDPATGAASAALAGYLRDIDWPHEGEINIVQGEDMGSRSLINVQLSSEAGSSIRVAGMARIIKNN
ncbi:MAG: PhzF family phenazine biosynthesis protein [Nitratireductor sp.]